MQLKGFGVGVLAVVGFPMAGLAGLVIGLSSTPKPVAVSESVKPIEVAAPNITMAEFDRITMGATLPQVEQVLGKGELSSQITSSGTDLQSWMWRDGLSGNMIVTFDKGKASSKVQTNLRQSSITTTAQPVRLPLPVSSPSPVTTAPDFAAMPPCDQLDAVAKSGKSVAEFVRADWSRFGGVVSVCSWHQPQIETAKRVLFPPAESVRRSAAEPPAVKTKARTVTASSGSRTIVAERDDLNGAVPMPRTPRQESFNNCDGIQQSGESYSAGCHRAQVLNDAGLATRSEARRDEREFWDMPANGYSGKE